MTNPGQQIMTPVEFQNYLAHYGVPGMRWGKRRAVGAPTSSVPGNAAVAAPKLSGADKKVARQARRVSKGQAILAKSGGSGKKAAAKIVGRRVVTGLLAQGIGRAAMATIGQKNPAVGIGIAAVAGMANNAFLAKDIMDGVAVRQAVKANRA